MKRLVTLLLASSVLVSTAGAQEDDVQSLSCEDFLEMDEAAQEEVLNELQSMGIGGDEADPGVGDANDMADKPDGEPAIEADEGDDAPDMPVTDEAVSDDMAADQTASEVTIETDEGDLTVGADFSSVIAACEGDPTLTIQAVLEAEDD